MKNIHTLNFLGRNDVGKNDVVSASVLDVGDGSFILLQKIKVRIFFIEPTNKCRYFNPIFEGSMKIIRT
jgi:hypothetical protein